MKIKFLAAAILACLCNVATLTAEEVPANQQNTAMTEEEQLRLKASPVDHGLLLREAQKLGEEGLKAAEFLWQYMPQIDKQTLTAEYLLTNIDYALKARRSFPWAAQIPFDIFLNDVLPYATVTERRDNWRPDFYKRFGKMILNCKTANEAVLTIMTKIQNELGVTYSPKRRRPDQGPMESMELKIASCSGLSILAVDACRAVGIPARIAGIPCWSHVQGNHNWIEVWINGQWHMTEYNFNAFDDGWVIDSCGLADTSHPFHKIYATTWKPHEAQPDLLFPMVWAMNFGTTTKDPTTLGLPPQVALYVFPYKNPEKPNEHYVMSYLKDGIAFHGIDVSERYKELAKKKAALKAEAEEGNKFALKIGFFLQGIQTEKEVTIICGKDKIFNLKTHDKSHDLNDLQSIELPWYDTITIKYEHNGEQRQKVIKPEKGETFVQKITL